MFAMEDSTKEVGKCGVKIYKIKKDGEVFLYFYNFYV
jgi:hypothetical protein